MVIPVYNEERTLRNLVERVCAVPIRKELILVARRFHRDGTREVLKQIAAEANHDPLDSFSIHYHDVNERKGKLRDQASHACGDFVGLFRTRPRIRSSEYPRLLQPIVEGSRRRFRQPVPG